MLNVSWKRMRGTLCALAAAALMGPGLAAWAQDGEGGVEAESNVCNLELTGPVGSGSAEIDFDAGNVTVTFTGVTNVTNVGIFNGATELLNLASGTPTSPVEAAVGEEDGAAILAAVNSGGVLRIQVTGDTNLNGSIMPCFGADEEGYFESCVLPLTSEDPEVTATGEVRTGVRLDGSSIKATVSWTGIATHTGVGVYFSDGSGTIVSFAAADTPSPVSYILSPEEQDAIDAAIAGIGARIAVLGTDAIIAANPADCTPGDGEGGGEGSEGEGEGGGEGQEGEGGGEGSSGPEGQLRFVHGAANLANLDICVEEFGGTAAVAAADVAFGTITDYETRTAAVYDVTVYAAGEGCSGTALANINFFLEPDQSITLAIADLDIAKGLGTQILIVTDDNTPGSGVARVRAFNLSTNTGTVDILLDGNTVIDDLLFGASNYVDVAPGIYVPAIADGAGTVLATGGSVAMGDGGVYTIYALGLNGGTPALAASTSSEVEGLPVEGEEGEGGGEGGEGEGEGAEGEGEGGGEGAEGEGEGADEPIDFCTLQDELAGIIDDPILGPVLTDLLGEDISLLQLLACDVADLNGELPVLAPEGEEPSIADQLPDPNGILDGPYELAVLAELINNGGAYTDLAANGGIDSTAVAAAFDTNLTLALGSLAGVPPSELAPLFALLLGDALEGEVEGEAAREEIILRAAELVPNIGLLLAGYITLGDDNSIAVALLVLEFINDATDCILGLAGVTDCVEGVYDPNIFTRLDGLLSADQDADGDGCTQRAEFAGFVDTPTTEEYVAAVLDPEIADCPQPIDFCAVMDDLAGIVEDPILGPVLTDLLGEDIAILQQLGCPVADLNGPLPVIAPEGEETPIADQLPDPNGILDGPYELAVLAELINNPDAYADLVTNGGVNASAVGPAFEANLALALGSLAGVPPSELAPLFALLLGDALEGEIEGQGARDEIILRAAELVPNIGLLLTGYITLGDDNSVAVALLVLQFINDATDCILGLGGVTDCVEGVYDPNIFTRLEGILSIGGDADGDGCTQQQEYEALAGGKGALTTEAYVDAVLDPDSFPVNCEGTAQRHDADTDEDGQINLNELLRIIQLYNAGVYTCATIVTEDGYQPDDDGINIGVGVCVAHDIDFDGTDGQISLSELLRAIQLYNLEADLVFTGGGEDGWGTL